MMNAFFGVILALQSKNVIDFAVANNREELISSAVFLGILIILQFVLSFLYMKISADIVAKHTLKLQRRILYLHHKKAPGKRRRLFALYMQ